MDSSLQTHLLSHWVREKQAFTLEEAVKLITNDTATQFGFHDRGLLREGMAADIVVFDPDTVGPRMPEVVCDLPAGAKRLKQKCDGMHATIVNGQVLLRDNEPTGNLPGRLLRRKVARFDRIIPSLDFVAPHNHTRRSPLVCGLTKISRDRATRLSFDGASSRDNPQNKSRPSRARERAKSRPTYACPKGTVGGQKDYLFQ